MNYRNPSTLVTLLMSPLALSLIRGYSSSAGVLREYHRAILQAGSSHTSLPTVRRAHGREAPCLLLRHHFMDTNKNIPHIDGTNVASSIHQDYATAIPAAASPEGGHGTKRRISP
ncbi:hypothetical protein BDM02DRAFT_1976742 [Thelephora ganbajun]|uniref:Uncharacterized protein n=1 Tax=Thelephora ganbajun TaxID=370292 RepID=A0ACB6YZN7_THEGA|nr:hypothetical protein BDM02DRAFT_1976742 [Thelephora ganbajun]